MISERAFADSFDSFWSELLPLLTPRFVAIFNGAYEKILVDGSNRLLSAIPVPQGMKNNDVVAEFAFRLAFQAFQKQIQLSEIESNLSLLATIENEAFNLIERYEGRPASTERRFSELERREGIVLAKRYDDLYRFFQKKIDVDFCPHFPGSGFLNSCEGDLRIDNCLVEVKTTVRRPSSKDLRQLIVYAALGTKHKKFNVRKIAIFNPRRGTLHLANLDLLILRLSGGRPTADVFSDLIAFTQSNEPAIERRF